jgi:hypothetical protein
MSFVGRERCNRSLLIPLLLLTVFSDASKIERYSQSRESADIIIPLDKQSGSYLASASSARASSIKMGSRNFQGPQHTDQINDASMLKHVTIFIVADVGSLQQLRAAHCTYMTVIDPNQVVHVADFKLGRIGGCGFPITKVVYVPYATQYYDMMGYILRTKIELHTWCLFGKDIRVLLLQIFEVTSPRILDFFFLFKKNSEALDVRAPRASQRLP